MARVSVAHMCQSGHVEIYHNDSSNEMCPLCRCQAALREALDGWHKVAEHWIHQYAGEMCDEKLVDKSMREVQDAGGTLMRIAIDNARIRELRAQFLDDK